MESQKPSFSILMFPWIAHGHIFPYLELSRALLNRKNFQIHLCTTAINFDSINTFIDNNSLRGSIKLVELELEPSPDLPPHYHTTKNVPESLKLTLIKAFQTSNSSFSNILTTLKPNLVMYDMFQPWAAKIAASQGIPAIHFSIFGAVPLALVHHRHTFGAAPFPFPALQFEEHEVKSLNSIIEFLFAHIYDADQDFLVGSFKHSCDIVLIKTSRGIEEKYIDYLSTLSEKKLVPLGPLINHTNSQNNDQNSDIMRWLSKKSRHSTLFISFGSEYFLSKEEIEEIAKGLELTSVNFIWIIRSPLGSADEALPRGFLDRVGDRGVVVTGWAPQASILGHENTAGFVSHCGWSSTMESMYFGVPVVAMAMKVDQPVNARMLAEAGSCVEVRRKDGDVFKAEAIATAIEEVMAEESGGELRRRARGLSAALRMEEGEVLDGVAEQVWQLCLKKQNAGSF